MIPRSQKLGAVAVALAALLLTAACSDDEASSDAEGTEGTEAPVEEASDEVEEARARMEPFLGDQSQLALTEKLSTAPEPGKTIVWLQCSQSACASIGDGIEEAAAVVGWTVKRIDYSESDPESVITAMNQAVDGAPDGIAVSGVPSERYEIALARAQEAGIPVIESSVVDEVGGLEGNGVVGLISGPVAYAEGGSIVADWVIQDSDGAASVLLVSADDFPIIKFEIDEVAKDFEERCSDCTVKRLNQAVADIGTNTPTNVVSALQEDPSIDYVYFGFGDLSMGVSAAIADAGLDAKIVGLAPTTENHQRVIDGEEAAWAGFSTPLVGWDIVDALARFFNGDDMAVVSDQPSTYQLFTQDSPPSSEDPIFPASYEQLYSDLWLLG